MHLLNNRYFCYSTAQDTELRDKNLSPTRIGTAPISIYNYGQLICHLLQRYFWTSVYLLIDEDSASINQALATAFLDASRDLENMQVLTTRFRATSHYRIFAMLEQFRVVSRGMLMALLPVEKTNDLSGSEVYLEGAECTPNPCTLVWSTPISSTLISSLLIGSFLSPGRPPHLVGIHLVYPLISSTFVHLFDQINDDKLSGSTEWCQRNDCQQMNGSRRTQTVQEWCFLADSYITRANTVLSSACSRVRHFLRPFWSNI